MNREEATKFLAIIKVAYPSTYKDIDKDTAIATVNMWQATFEQVPLVIMEMAFDNYRKSSKFAPTPADIIEELKSLYYVAVGDALTSSGDKLKLCEYVMKHTDSFRNSVKASINYGVLNNRLLQDDGSHKLLLGDNK